MANETTNQTPSQMAAENAPPVEAVLLHVRSGRWIGQIESYYDANDGGVAFRAYDDHGRIIAYGYSLAHCANAAAKMLGLKAVDYATSQSPLGGL